MKFFILVILFCSWLSLCKCCEDSCVDDVFICPTGQTVVRDPCNDCEFYECPACSDFCPPLFKTCPDGTLLTPDPCTCQFEECPPLCLEEPAADDNTPGFLPNLLHQNMQSLMSGTAFAWFSLDETKMNYWNTESGTLVAQFHVFSDASRSTQQGSSFLNCQQLKLKSTVEDGDLISGSCSWSQTNLDGSHSVQNFHFVDENYNAYANQLKDSHVTLSGSNGWDGNSFVNHDVGIDLRVRAVACAPPIVNPCDDTTGEYRTYSVITREITVVTFLLDASARNTWNRVTGEFEGHFNLENGNKFTMLSNNLIHNTLDNSVKGTLFVSEWSSEGSLISTIPYSMRAKFVKEKLHGLAYGFITDTVYASINFLWETNCAVTPTPTPTPSPTPTPAPTPTRAIIGGDDVSTLHRNVQQCSHVQSAELKSVAVWDENKPSYWSPDSGYLTAHFDIFTDTTLSTQTGRAALVCSSIHYDGTSVNGYCSWVEAAVGSSRPKHEEFRLDSMSTYQNDVLTLMGCTSEDTTPNYNAIYILLKTDGIFQPECVEGRHQIEDPSVPDIHDIYDRFTSNSISMIDWRGAWQISYFTIDPQSYSWWDLKSGDMAVRAFLHGFVGMKKDGNSITFLTFGGLRTKKDITNQKIGGTMFALQFKAGRVTRTDLVHYPHRRYSDYHRPANQILDGRLVLWGNNKEPTLQVRTSWDLNPCFTVPQS